MVCILSDTKADHLWQNTSNIIDFDTVGGISVSISKIDGRQQRSERSRQQIIDAMRKLVEAGVYIPTAQQVADEAEINIRTVFRHFSDMDQLYYEIDRIQRPSYNRHFVGQDFTGTLEQRIRLVVEARISCYVETYAMEKATHACCALEIYR